MARVLFFQITTIKTLVFGSYFLILTCLSCTKEAPYEIVLTSPADLCFSDDGSLLVLDSSKSKILYYDRNLRSITTFGGPGTGNGLFLSPLGMASLPARNLPWTSPYMRMDAILVADTGNNRLQLLDSTGKLWHTWPGSETETPFAVALNKYGFYVSLTIEDRVIFVDWEKKELKTLLKMKGPMGIFSDYQDNIWVAFAGTNRILKFDHQGNFLSSVGDTKEPESPSSLKNPVDVWVSREYVYIADTGRSRVAVFDHNQRFVAEYKKGLYAPTAVAVREKGEKILVVADREKVIRLKARFWE